MMSRVECHCVKRGIRPVLLLAACCLLLTVFVVSCGRRGDPVLILPSEEIGTAEKSGMAENQIQAPDLIGTGEDTLTVMQPQAPEGLDAVFTGQKIILVWDEVAGQGVKSYRIYRSAGDDFSLMGEVVTPVFHDRDIESGARYFYKVTAVGQTESIGSDTVEVVAGGD
jgi:hypothetical protein